MIELSLDNVLNRIIERTVDNQRQLKKGVDQRRNGMQDLYGVEFTHNGDANNPATFYVSVSPDLVYYERFAFKFIIQPYESSVAGVSGGGSLTIGDTELTATCARDPSVPDDPCAITIAPNPHTHSVSGSIGGLSYGIKRVSTSSTNWRVKIHGVDITPYLVEQHDGDWINGEGIFPNNRLVGEEDFYDILDVACMLQAEGRTADVEKILAPEFKKVEILSDQPFSITAFLYLKYSHCNR